MRHADPAGRRPATGGTGFAAAGSRAPAWLSGALARSTIEAHTMPKTPSAPASFEAALAELEAIVSSMEGGQVPLKESLEAYRRGAELLKYCQATLKDAQLEIEVLEKGVLKAFRPEDGDE